MLGFIKKLFGDYNESEIKRMRHIVEEVNDLEKMLLQSSDEELRGCTDKFRDRLQQGDTLQDILPEAFAVVREAGRRVLNMRHFDVQLIGGMVLNDGRIAEMRTGEGKTLVATLAAYLNALSGDGVHVITVNDYLAKRDAEWMGRLYSFLGLSVGLIVHGMDYAARRQSYNADITYGTNNEFGFDYLRDNMVVSRDQMVQRPLNFAIVDEVDSILVDEARTPLIISGPGEKSTDSYYRLAKAVPRLTAGEDYTIDEKAHSVSPTEEGIAKIEKILGIGNIYESGNLEISHCFQQALKAHALMHRDKDYVIKNSEVVIVDEFTGRMMFGRRYSDGLHQAIEAKEGLKVERESQTLAAITFQNYFRMYKKLAGMTGTAKTEEAEFRKIYNLEVIEVPTHQPMVRHDYPDVIYKTRKAKYIAVVEEICRLYAERRPVLVGTTSIAQSEELSQLLKKRGVQHNVLNAKYHESEAQIISQAGQLGVVTIATNMAGRGTDIVLAETVAKEKSGLHIIGTERHESRRIDNQLRGRCGRQGDPGSTRFYLSLEDDLLRLFGENIALLMDKLGMEEDVPIESPLVTKAIERAQKKVEAHNFSIRKHVLEYDDVMNQQREVIYGQRHKILDGENLRENINGMIRYVIDAAVDIYTPAKVYPEEWDLAGLIEHFNETCLPHSGITVADLQPLAREELSDFFEQKATEFYNSREQELGEAAMRELERIIMLRVLDNRWIEHLDDMDSLRQGIGLRAYGQRDPLTEYKHEAYDMFNAMMGSIQDEIVRHIFRVRVISQPEDHLQNAVERHDVANESAKQPIKKPVTAVNNIGRNELCSCGSGKKFKRCCGQK